MVFDFPIASSHFPFPDWGNLGINAYDIDLDMDPHREPMGIRCWRIFSNLLQTAYGRELVSQLQQDVRVNAHKDKMISTGSGGGRFEIDRLAMWYLWLLNRSSKELADEALERFLDKSEIRVLALIGLEGIAVSAPIELTPNLKLSPVDELPECDLKDQIYRERTSQSHFKMPSTVQGLLFGNFEVPKLCNDVPRTDDLAELWMWFQNAYDSALLLNSMEGVASLPTFQTTVVGNDTPFGPFSSSGSSRNIHGRTTWNTLAVDTIDGILFNSVASAFQSVVPKKKEAWRMALTRLAFAKTAANAPDAALELGIAIEMMLQSGKKEIDIAMAFRLRGAWLLEPNDPNARRTVFDTLKFLYGCRCDVAHSGILSADKQKQFEAQRTQLHSIAERVACKMLVEPPANWDDVILSC